MAELFEDKFLKLGRDQKVAVISRCIQELTLVGRAHYGEAHATEALQTVNEAVHRLISYIELLLSRSDVGDSEALCAQMLEKEIQSLPSPARKTWVMRGIDL